MHHREPEASPASRGGPRRGLLHGPQDLVGLPETTAAQQHCAVEVLRLDPLGDRLGLCHAVHQRRADHPVATQPDQLGGRVWLVGE